MSTVIHASNLTKIFGKSIAVNHVSFEVQKGEIFGFLGPTVQARPPQPGC